MPDQIPADSIQADSGSEDITESIRGLLKSKRVDVFALRQLCKDGGHIQQSVRAEVWQALLGVGLQVDRSHLERSIMAVEGDLENQRVIVADAERTRADYQQFRSPEVKELIIRLLTFYCKRRGVRYKQGLNEVLAPFILLKEPPLPEGVIFNMFYALITKFLPNVYSDDEFKSLQCSFHLFRLLIQYHNPLLCHHLDQYNMSPELYATPWFITLFARGLDPDCLFQLWDFYLLEGNPYLHHFAAFAFLNQHQEEILRAEVADLPGVLTGIAFQSVEEVSRVCQEAKALLAKTPKSFCQHLHSACYCPVTQSTAPLLQSLESEVCLSISASELVTHLVLKLSEEKSDGCQKSSGTVPQYFVLDCRTLSEFEQCHLAVSFHLDPELLSAPEKLAPVLDSFNDMKNVHFCLIGHTDRNRPGQEGASDDAIKRKTATEFILSKFGLLAPDASARVPERSSLDFDEGYGDSQIGVDEDQVLVCMALILLQKGYPYVSRLEGGFDAVIEALSVAGQDVKVPLLVGAPNDEPERRHSPTLEELERRFPPLSIPPTKLSSLVRLPSPPILDPTLLLRKGLATASKAIRGLGESQGQTSLDKMHLQEVELPEGPLGVILADRTGDHKFSAAMIDSIIPHSEAQKCGKILQGDCIIGVAGRTTVALPFQDIVQLIQETPRPVKLTLARRGDVGLATKRKDEEGFRVPPPVLLSAMADCLGVSWRGLPYATKYELQLGEKGASAIADDDWKTIVLLRGSQEHQPPSSGTISGLPSGSVVLFRVRAGNDILWGPFSSPSHPMRVIGKLEGGAASGAGGEAGRIDASLLHFSEGCEALEKRETGRFFYRVLVPVALRSEPNFHAQRLDAQGMARGQLIEAEERLIQPGSSQVFVRLKNSQAWLFENTMEGRQVLERVPDDSLELLQAIGEHQSMDARDPALPQLPPPNVYSTENGSLFVSWTGVDDPVLATVITGYDLQYGIATSFPMTRWKFTEGKLDGDAISYRLSDITLGASYTTRIRTRSKKGVGPWSEESEPVQAVDRVGGTSPSPKKSGFRTMHDSLSGEGAAHHKHDFEVLSLSSLGPVNAFDGKYVLDFGSPHQQLLRCRIMVTSSELLFAVKSKGSLNPDSLHVIKRCDLTKLTKITSRKTLEDLLVLYFKADGEQEQVALCVPDLKDCVNTIKITYKSLISKQGSRPSG